MARWSMVVAGRRHGRQARCCRRPGPHCGERAQPAGAGGHARGEAGVTRRRMAARVAAGAGGGRARSGGRSRRSSSLFADGVEQALSRHRQRRRHLRQRARRIEFYGQWARHAVDGGPDLLAGRGARRAGKRVPLVGLSGEAGRRPRASAGRGCCASERPTSRRSRTATPATSSATSVGHRRRDRVAHGHPPRQLAAGRAAAGPAGGHRREPPGGDLRSTDSRWGPACSPGRPRRPALISPVSVAEGANDVLLVGQGDSPDESLVASVEIDYPHLFVADGDRAQPDRAARHADRHRRVLDARRAGDGRDRSDEPDRARDQRGRPRVDRTRSR